MIVFNCDGKRNETFGDSNLVGFGIEDKSLKWSTLLANECNGIDYNNGYSGQGWLPNGVFTFNENSLPYFNSSLNKYCFLANGTNDLPLPIEDATKAIWKARLLAIVDFAVSDRFWSYERLVLPTIIPRFDGDYTARILMYKEAIEEICALRNCIYIDEYTQFIEHPDIESLYSDDVHTNLAGQRFQADIFKNADYTPYNGVPDLTTYITITYTIS